MKYFSLNCVEAAYKSISETTKDKFWGILGILYSIGDIIQPNRNYLIDTYKLSTFLEESFRLANKKNYSEGSDNVYSVIFANDWEEQMSLFTQSKPNVVPVLVWAYRRTAFSDGVTEKDLIERFLNDFHMSKSLFDRLFHINFKDFYLEYDNNLYEDRQLFHNLGGNDFSENFTVKLNKSFVVANAGDLTRGPFFQPLYAALNTLACLIIFPFDASEYYTFDADKNNQKGLCSTLLNTILYGPPGTGKTYEMQKIFAGYPEGNRSVITFHQSYSYEEFIIGLKAKTKEDGNIEYSYEKGVFYNACERAAVLAGYSSLAECCSDTKESRNAKFAAIAGDTSRQFLFCIDEINRANISAVFGDLISLIEENKRLGAQNEMIVRLPYTQELFGVPANLRLLGTMNTADRSIQILDTALRRRFQFKEYLPDYDVLRNEKAKTILQAINGRIRALLGQDRQIGHSYFYDIEASAADESIRILKALANKIIPLLQEYFYNDVEKIRFVLGEKDRIPDEHSFYIEDGDATAAFSRYDSDSEETSFYILNTEGIASASMSNESASAFIDHITA